MNLTQLLTHFNLDRLAHQFLHDSLVSASVPTSDDALILFQTDQYHGRNLANIKNGRVPAKVGLVIWLPVKEFPEPFQERLRAHCQEVRQNLDKPKSAVSDTAA